MSAVSHPKDFKRLLSNERTTQVIGTPTPFIALMAEQLGAQAIYLSGASVANFLHGIPDTGMITLENVAQAASAITQVANIPLLVDIDTGFQNIGQTIAKLLKVGVAAVHIEDQVSAVKRCGHLDGKKVVSPQEMIQRIVEADQARQEAKSFSLMARTDAFAIEGLAKTIERAQAYIEAGADMIFAEALTDLAQYATFCNELKGIPVLANMTEFGKTKLYTLEALSATGVAMALYPRSCERAMSQAALAVIQDILQNGSQKNSLTKMQTRNMTQKILGYEATVTLNKN